MLDIQFFSRFYLIDGCSQLMPSDIGADYCIFSGMCGDSFATVLDINKARDIQRAKWNTEDGVLTLMIFLD